MAEQMPAPGDLILYRTEDGRTRVEVRLADETVWMTQAGMAELYQTTPQNVTLHLKAIYNEDELDETATCKEFLQVQQEGLRRVSRIRKFYNLYAILSVADRLAEEEYKIFNQQRLKAAAHKDALADDAELKKYLKGENL